MQVFLVLTQIAEGVQSHLKFSIVEEKALGTRLTAQLETTLATAPSWQMRLTGRVHSLWRELYFNGNFWLCTRLVSRICHEGAVANVDFKLCRSSLDGHMVRWKVETSSSEAKIVRIGAESLKIFPSRPDKRTNGLSFFALEGKIEQRIRISARKRPLGSGLSKQQCPALTSSIESYDKHLKTPQKRRNRPNGQQK